MGVASAMVRGQKDGFKSVHVDEVKKWRERSTLRKLYERFRHWPSQLHIAFKPKQTDYLQDLRVASTNKDETVLSLFVSKNILQVSECFLFSLLRGFIFLSTSS